MLLPFITCSDDNLIMKGKVWAMQRYSTLLVRNLPVEFSGVLAQLYLP